MDPGTGRRHQPPSPWRRQPGVETETRSAGACPQPRKFGQPEWSFSSPLIGKDWGEGEQAPARTGGANCRHPCCTGRRPAESSRDIEGTR